MPLIAKKTWCEVGGAGGRKVIIPLGSIEQHGPHLPLDTDSLLVERIAREVAVKVGGLLAPTICLGVSEEHMDFKGTLTLKPDSFRGMVSDVCTSLSRHGFVDQHIINSHGGNSRYLRDLIPDLRGLGFNVSLHGVSDRLGIFDHAGGVETSLMLFLFPDKVRVDKIRNFKYRIPDCGCWRMRDYSDMGVIGDALSASREKGRIYFNKIVKGILEEM